MIGLEIVVLLSVKINFFLFPFGLCFAGQLGADGKGWAEFDGAPGQRGRQQKMSERETIRVALQ